MTTPAAAQVSLYHMDFKPADFNPLSPGLAPGEANIGPTNFAMPGFGWDGSARFEPVIAALTIQLQEARSAMAAGDYGRAAERTHALETGVAELSTGRPR